MTLAARKSELEVYPGFALGRAAESLGQERSAIAYYRNEIRRTAYCKAHYNLGLLLKRRRRFREAILHFKQAALRSPDSKSAAIAFNALAVAHSKLGHAEEALEAFRQSVRRNPADPLPLANAALELLEMGEHRRGTQWLHRARIRRRRNKAADDLIAYALIAYDIDVGRGVSILEKLLRHDRNNARALADLAVGYLKTGNLRRAMRMAERAKDLAAGDREVKRQIELVRLGVGERGSSSFIMRRRRRVSTKLKK